MSMQKSLKPNKKSFAPSSYKVQPPSPISTSPQSSSAFTFVLSSHNLIHKENDYQKNILSGQQSCRALKKSKPLDELKPLPQTARNNSISDSSKSSETLYKEHLFNTFQAMKFVRTLCQPTEEEILSKSVFLDKRTGYENKRTIIFDLDETLVHCINRQEDADFYIEIPGNSGKVFKAGVNVRPYAREILAYASERFEVIVFTASHRAYADLVMNELDPRGDFIHHRLYRENCLVKNGVFIKDLRIFRNRNLRDIVIVDNSAYCFAYQIENGVPIISWFSDRSDRELWKLMDYIQILANVPDVCLVNRKTFRLNSFYNDYLRDYLKFQERET